MGPPSDPVRRGGTRVPCEICATMSCSDLCQPFAEEPCRIVLVNYRGCAASIRRAVSVGTSVRLHDLPASTNVGGRVVNCISLGEHEKLWLLGIALDEPGNVWAFWIRPTIGFIGDLASFLSSPCRLVGSVPIFRHQARTRAHSFCCDNESLLISDGIVRASHC